MDERLAPSRPSLSLNLGPKLYGQTWTTSEVLVGSYISRLDPGV